MNRFFLGTEHIDEGKVTFPPDIAHQILHVLRLRGGDFVEVLDGDGQISRVALSIDVETSHVTGVIVETSFSTTESKVRVSLCFGLSNREKVEWILQKGTEIGVSAFFPFVSSRTLVQSTMLSQKKFDRWERIIREAAEQSHRGRLPVLNQPLDLETCFSTVTNAHDLNLIAWEEATDEERNVKNLIDTFTGNSIALFVGPKGGFSENEIKMGETMGCQVVSLGERILRMETAAIVFPAIVLHDLGDI